MAYFKTGFYIRVFVKGIEGINNPSWVKIHCGPTQADQQQRAEEYRKQKYEVEILPFSENQKIKEQKSNYL